MACNPRSARAQGNFPGALPGPPPRKFRYATSVEPYSSFVIHALSLLALQHSDSRQPIYTYCDVKWVKLLNVV
jgi:hypothetical protein